MKRGSSRSTSSRRRPQAVTSAAFAPRFGDYKAIVLNYDAPDDRWPAALKTAFEQYVWAAVVSSWFMPPITHSPDGRPTTR